MNPRTDDSDDDISDVFAGVAPLPPRVVRPQPPAPAIADEEDDGAVPPREFIEICAKCAGTGGYRGRSQYGYKCFACKGEGKRVRKTSPEARAKKRLSGVKRKERIANEALAAFAAAHPVAAAWIEARRESFDFARAMRDAVVKFGSLTERQLAACERLVAQDAARKAEAEARVTSAPAVTTDRLMAAFGAAKASGLKRPKMRFDGFTASLAPETSKNAGAVYLKTGEVYLGKIAGGKFQASRDCDAAKREAIVEAMADPLAAAVAYGRRSGSCSCCGRELTDPVSVERGIGPICAENFGL